jgi:hypothetical protein
MPRGDDKTFTEYVGPAGLDSNGINGWQFWLTVKYDDDDADGDAVFQKVPGEWQMAQKGDASTQGIAFCNIVPADTNSLPGHQVALVYDVQAKDTAGHIFTLESGTWTVTADSTVSTT